MRPQPLCYMQMQHVMRAQGKQVYGTSRGGEKKARVEVVKKRQLKTPISIALKASLMRTH